MGIPVRWDRCHEALAQAAVGTEPEPGFHARISLAGFERADLDDVPIATFVANIESLVGTEGAPIEVAQFEPVRRRFLLDAQLRGALPRYAAMVISTERQRVIQRLVGLAVEAVREPALFGAGLGYRHVFWAEDDLRSDVASRIDELRDAGVLTEREAAALDRACVELDDAFESTRDDERSRASRLEQWTEHTRAALDELGLLGIARLWRAE